MIQRFPILDVHISDDDLKEHECGVPAPIPVWTEAPIPSAPGMVGGQGSQLWFFLENTLRLRKQPCPVPRGSLTDAERQRPSLFPQFVTTLMNHPNSRAPGGIPRGLSVAVQLLPLPNPATLTSLQMLFSSSFPSELPAHKCLSQSLRVSPGSVTTGYLQPLP